MDDLVYLFFEFANFSLKGFSPHNVRQILFIQDMKHLSGVMYINCAYHDDSSFFDDLLGRQKFQRIGLAYKYKVSATHWHNLSVMSF